MANCIIGCHSSIKKGVLEAVKYTDKIGGNATQIFLGSRESSSLTKKKQITDEEAVEIKKWLKANKHILIIHAVYTLNFCKFKPGDKKYKYVTDNLVWDLNMTEKIGGIGCVLHIGYQLDLSEKDAYENMAANVKHVLDLTRKSAPNTKIILETPAGKGTQIGTKLDEFGKLWEMCSEKRVGVCVDTAHIFSSGEDIRKKSGIKQYLENFDKIIGIENLTCFHINDSKAELNSRKDLHEGIGKGFIYNDKKGGNLESLYELWKFSKKHQIPMILETHGAGFYDSSTDNGKLYQEIQLFRSWDKKSKNLDFDLKDTFQLPFNKIVLPKNTNNKKKEAVKKNGVISCVNFEKNEKKSCLKNEKDKIYELQKKTGKKRSLKKNKEKNINKIVAEQFKILSEYYKITGDNIRMNAYKKAIYQIEHLDKELKSGDDIKDLIGIGKEMSKKIDEIIKTGKLNKIKELDALNIIASYNKKHKLNKVMGIGDKKAEKLGEQGIETINNLKQAVNSGDITLTNQQQIGLNYHNNLSEMIPREESQAIRTKISQIVSKSKIKEIKELRVELVGSFPSGSESSKDVDILITRYNSERSKLGDRDLMLNVVRMLEEKGLVVERISLGFTKFTGLVKLTPDSIARHIDIFLTDIKHRKFAYFHYTNGAEFNKIIREKAKSMGYTLNEYGLYRGDTKVKNIYNMKDLFKILDMKYLTLKQRY